MNKYHRPNLFVLFLIIINVSVIAQQKATVFHNGKIYTSNERQPEVSAMAIRGDKIIAVGELEAVKAAAGKGATMNDLQGHCLVPGLIDSHNHAVTGGRSLMIAFLGDTFLEEDSLAKFANYAMTSKRGMRDNVLFIMGFHSNTWAHIDMLDRIFNNTPYTSQSVALKGSDGHTSWANNAMLKRASITAEFIKTLPDDKQKYFGLKDTGEPNGLIAESGFEYIDKVMPPSPIKWNDALVSGMKHLNSLGITAWMDPSAGSTADGQQNVILTAYSEVSKQPSFSAHVTAVIRADGNKDPTGQITVAKQWQEKFKGNQKVSVVGFKIFADGVMEFPTQTASMLVPYKNSGQQGSQMVDPEKFKQFVIASDRAKMLVHIHSIGDRAVTDALDAIEAARHANGNSIIPHSITHLQTVNPKDLPRFGSLNVPVSMQLLWASKDIYTEDLVRPYIDETAYAYMYPVKSILAKGGLVAGASDWSVSSANPFEAIYMAEKRVGKLGVLNEAEIISRADMIKAYTINAAKVVLLDKTIGSIEVGKQADLVLLDRDIATVSSESVKDTQVLWTMFGGNVVYKK